MERITLFLAAIILVSATKIEAAVQPPIFTMPEVMYSSGPTAKVDNFILQHQRQFEEQIKSLDNQLKEFQARFELRLDVIQYYDAIVDVKLREIEDKLDPLEMLGDVNDYCVEKYRGKIPSQSVLKANLNTCITKAESSKGSMLTNMENTLKNIRNHYNNQFTNSIKDCKKKFDKLETKYQNCASTAIKTTSNYFLTNTNTFNTQMTAALCSANTRVDEAFDCYSSYVYQTFNAIGEATGLIENCVAGHDICTPCDNDENHLITKGRCPYQMAWHLADDDLTGDKIVNPFKSINSTTPCLQINFITNNFDDILS